ncbi:alpha/beta hydrolase [Flavobacterium zepuense]|uniref:Alpha/beta hydrolase n=1 Tax=Flavobacterium zepuense TaxID=2593302 RepID=A0A552V182_9FLAO|nr:alpha/beta hydrolase [Flavobacterium zepuense]TRW24241.1 alpha/beta hydrolase [Flavobacterium zepuense]
MKHLFSFITLLLLLITGNACSQQAKDIRKLQYGTHKQNILDLFLPASYTNKTPVVIVIHGGAWNLGDQYFTENVAVGLRERGFVVANIDYRYVSDSVHAKDLLADIDKAVAYMEKISKEYHFKSSGYHASGVSAGAHLALLYSYTSNKKIKSIEALCAPSILNDPDILAFINSLKVLKNIEQLANDTYTLGTKPSDKFTAISPIAQITQIPTLLVHGTKDKSVQYKNSTLMLEQLQKQKVPSKLLTMPGNGHDVGLNQPDTAKIVFDEMAAWVKKHD